MAGDKAITVEGSKEPGVAVTRKGERNVVGETPGRLLPRSLLVPHRNRTSAVSKRDILRNKQINKYSPANGNIWFFRDFIEAPPLGGTGRRRIRDLGSRIEVSDS